MRYVGRGLMLWVVCLWVMAWAATEVPKPGARVTDGADVLAKSDVEALAKQLQGIEKETGADVRVLIVPSLGGEAIEDFAQRVFDQWKPGHSGVDDGVLLVLSTGERRMRIAVGRGLEGAIPDLRAKQITSTRMVPAFKRGDFAGGFREAVAEIGSVLEKERAQVQGVQAVGASVKKKDVTWIALLIVAGAFGTVLMIPVSFILYGKRVTRMKEKERVQRDLEAREKLESMRSRLREEEAERDRAKARRWKIGGAEETEGIGAAAAMAGVGTMAGGWQQHRRTERVAVAPQPRQTGTIRREGRAGRDDGRTTIESEPRRRQETPAEETSFRGGVGGGGEAQDNATTSSGGDTAGAGASDTY